MIILVHKITLRSVVYVNIYKEIKVVQFNLKNLNLCINLSNFIWIKQYCGVRYFAYAS